MLVAAWCWLLAWLGCRSNRPRVPNAAVPLCCAAAAGARPAAGPLARHLSAELLSAGGRAWLAQAVRASLEWRLQEFAEALCQHGGLECVARLAAALPEAAEADSARRGLALALVAKAGPGECENLFAEVPGFRAALARVAEALGAVVAAGAPQAPNPGGWALPEGLVAALQCSNAPGPGELCTVCQPVAVSGRRGGALARS